MQFVDEWDKLLAVPAWTPIEQIGFAFSAVRDVLFQLSDNAFVLAPPRDAELRPSEVPRVTIAMWAGDIGIARRVVLREVEADSGTAPPSPPPELIAVRPTYTSIWNMCKNTGNNGPQVVAKYRIATDGRHTHTSIRNGGYEFMFRSVNPAADEPVIAVQVRLIGLSGEQLIDKRESGNR
jgi:hypothetical protein